MSSTSDEQILPFCSICGFCKSEVSKSSSAQDKCKFEVWAFFFFFFHSKMNLKHLQGPIFNSEKGFIWLHTLYIWLWICLPLSRTSNLLFCVLLCLEATYLFCAWVICNPEGIYIYNSWSVGIYSLYFMLLR